ncbi:60S ribosomal protein L14 [Salpingoeca rosetta]|uniref:60S ribosomal protein L14 n=1 Tax=Salpingoeca rosetta (strain ATCC 50818 / BSB-021) TaxID=946362 RepID=F2UI60_SALR5|nr:60S ribosomal protein L14 [Salpingoeca rosetta]EGD76809.1 60S ribosomal protein L14 [Salpingoeca rosetta]|eukprot:XP_004991181.1 60S ribosomal protein L14 [Salpingoeca rosetta]
MVFTRYVERGRVVLINQGPNEGKLAVIVNVIDNSRALVDGPNTGVVRSPLNFKHMNLTDFKIDIPLFARTSAVRKAFKEADISGKWAQSAWAKKIARREKRASLSDFERFVVKVNRIKRGRVVKSILTHEKRKAGKARRAAASK